MRRAELHLFFEDNIGPRWPEIMAKRCHVKPSEIRRCMDVRNKFSPLFYFIEIEARSLGFESPVDAAVEANLPKVFEAYTKRFGEATDNPIWRGLDIVLNGLEDPRNKMTVVFQDPTAVAAHRFAILRYCLAPLLKLQPRQGSPTHTAL